LTFDQQRQHGNNEPDHAPENDPWKVYHNSLDFVCDLLVLADRLYY